ncbi:PAS domain S-box protein [Stakelama marina]|uniref:histidine kinase n=1 Tax=Stakelama marina TaxID=2826939 RepID=A0A8T4IA09_9SPHN|nr:PAS domain S-box protein [Stakelama marina]MBR0550972.1 PAS domain S-box protein [Stakelama marina]
MGIGASSVTSVFGIDLMPVPLAMTGFACLAFSLLAHIRGDRDVATALLTVPALVLILFATQQVASVTVPNWVFLNFVGPVSTTATPVADLLLLTLATLLAQRPQRSAGAASVIFASLTLAFAVMSFVTLASDLIEEGALGRYLLMSPAAALCSVLLATAILALRQESGWPTLFRSGASGRILRTAFPAVLIVPVVMMVVELLLVRSDTLSAPLAGVLAACGNVVTLSAIVLWAARGIARSQAALYQTTEALDSAAVMITDRDGTILHWSEGCERLYGWSNAEAVGRSKYELLNTAERGQPATAPRLADGALSASRTLEECGKDGERITIVEDARLIKRPDEKLRLVLSVTDISELTRTTAALRESEARLELALDAHSIGIFEWDRKTGDLRWSLGAERRLGLIPGQITSFDDWTRFTEPEDLAVIERVLARAVAEKSSRFSFSYRFNAPSGEQRVIEGSSRCLYDADGELAGTVGVNIDVTDRVKADRALRASNEQFRSVLETVPSTMLIVDEQGTVLSFSKSAEALFGYAAEEIIGQPVTLLTREDTDGNGLSENFSAEHARTPAGMRTLTARHRDGSDVPVEVWVGEFGTEKSRLFTIFMRDISERLLAQERLYDLRTELAHVSRVNTMGEIAAGIAHELNQPLSAMVNFLGAAKMMLKPEAPRPEQATEVVQLASEQAMRAGDIIRRLRQFVSRGEVEMHPLHLDKVVEESVALMQLGGGQYDITLDIDLSDDLPRALADRVQVQQVLVNLLRNAIEELRKMPKDQRRIGIRAKQIDAEVIEMCIEDSGPGLPDNMLDQLYTPFVSTKKTGMGVGLSICRRIVEAHDGTLTAENKEEGGAVFRFTLPAMREEELA